MTPRKKARRPSAAAKKPRAATADFAARERRRNRALREVLDELISLVRHVSRGLDTLPPAELEYAQQRMEWLADEVWRLVLEGSEK